MRDDELERVALVMKPRGRDRLNVTVTVGRVLSNGRVFVRSHTPDGGGLVTSCTGAAAAFALALRGTGRVPDSSTTVRVFGTAGAADIELPAGSTQPMVKVRGAHIYTGSLPWESGRLGNIMQGDIDMEVVLAQARSAEQELATLPVEETYEAKG